MPQSPLSHESHGIGSLLTIALSGACLATLWWSAANAWPVYLSVTSDSGSDTLRVGDTCSLIFRADSTEGLHAIGFAWPISMVFTNGNLVGPLTEAQHVHYSTQALSVFESISWSEMYGDDATDPDTILVDLSDLGGSPIWDSGAEMWRVTFVPPDTGHILVDSVEIGPLHHLMVFDPFGNLPFVWTPRTFVVVPRCEVHLTGDVNVDSNISSADIIGLVNFVFKGGASPQPCVAAGDVNCSAAVTSSDIIELVNIIFKGAQAECDVCSLVVSGAWACQ